MKISDYKRSIKAKLSKRIFMNLGIFASFLMVTVLSLYAWSPAKESSAFDWTTVDGASPYVASLSGDDEIRISATPSASQTIFDQDDTLELTSTCPYGAVIYLNMDSSESNSLSRTGTDEGIKTISATTGTALNDNSWGYSLDNGSTFLPMPLSTGTPVNIYNSEQVESNTEITVKYGMKIDSSIPSGYYSGNVLYSIVTNPSCAKYTLSFDTDGGTTIEDVLLTYGQTIDLPDYTTTKDNYVFDGWELIGSVSTTYDGTETDVDVNPGNALTVELKAKWVAAQTTFNSIRTLQEMTPSICNAETTPIVGSTGTTYQHSDDTSFVPAAVLTDTRDGNEYVVKKLADGRCWMTENLKLGGDTAITIDSSKSDLPGGETYTIPASNISDFTTAYNTSAAYLDSTYGGYYNFYTATAGWGTNSVSSGDSPKSICPKGWRLPTGDTNGEYQTLYNNYSSSALLQGDPNFIISGYAFDGSAYNDEGSGLLGYFWSSTVKDAKNAYDLRLNSSDVYPTGHNGKYNGFSIRCIAYNEAMQGFDESTLATGESKRLFDERDGNVYTVKKLTDGNVWMTENLRIAGKEITSADSNVTSNYTIPESNIASIDGYDVDAAYDDPEYGGFYNFYTATAGWGTQSVSSGNAPQDICPKGWRMPTGGSGGEFEGLSLTYMELQPQYGGYIGYGTIRVRGSISGFWSSTVSSSSSAFAPYIRSSNTANLSSYSYAENYGFNIRCIVKRPTMQSFNATTMLLNVGDSMNLVDTRDGNIYTVKRLADGNVWMTQNLRLGKDTTMTLTSADSDVTSNYQLPAKITTLSSTDFSAQDTGNVYIDSTYGGYYNFYTATADTGGTSLTSGNAPSSICPKGWRLPTGGEGGEFLTLYDNYSSKALLQGDPGLILSGDALNGSLVNQGTYGYFWSSTVYNANRAYFLHLGSSLVDPASNYNKYYGFPVRCMAQ